MFSFIPRLTLLSWLLWNQRIFKWENKRMRVSLKCISKLPKNSVIFFYPNQFKTTTYMNSIFVERVKSWVKKLMPSVPKLRKLEAQLKWIQFITPNVVSNHGDTKKFDNKFSRINKTLSCQFFNNYLYINFCPLYLFFYVFLYIFDNIFCQKVYFF